MKFYKIDEGLYGYLGTEIFEKKQNFKTLIRER